MKKILIASVMMLVSLASVGAKASIVITDMLFINGPGGFEQPLTAAGSLYSGGGGSLSTDMFLGYQFTATQETAFMDNTGLWSGATGSQSAADDIFDYNDEIAAMSNGQIGVGLLFKWNNNPMTVLAIFDCAGSGTVENPFGKCVGTNPVIMDNGVFIGSIITLNAVPVPATVWLMGSGLLALVGIVRRRRMI